MISCFIREAFDAEDRQNFIISPGVIVQEGDVAEVGRVEAVEERVSEVRVVETATESLETREKTYEYMDKSVRIFSIGMGLGVERLRGCITLL
jgi:hypothetical protein